MRQLVGGRSVKHRAASTSAMGRFETEMLTLPENLAALADLPGRWIDAVNSRRPPKSITFDMDSSESLMHGDQEGAAWNCHVRSKCRHPLTLLLVSPSLDVVCLQTMNRPLDKKVHTFQAPRKFPPKVLFRAIAPLQPPEAETTPQGSS